MQVDEKLMSSNAVDEGVHPVGSRRRFAFARKLMPISLPRDSTIIIDRLPPAETVALPVMGPCQIIPDAVPLLSEPRCIRPESLKSPDVFKFDLTLSAKGGLDFIFAVTNERTAKSRRREMGKAAKATTTTRTPKDAVEPEEEMPLWMRFYLLLLPPAPALVKAAFILPANLYPFQLDGVTFLHNNQHALLADEMGLGKTVQAIVAINLMLLQVEAGAFPTPLERVLVVCPKTIKLQWEREFERWAPELLVWRVEGNKAERERVWKRPTHVTIANYEQVRSDTNVLDGMHFDLVVLDEAQRIKNRDASVARACKRLNRTYSWCLTGTPLENRMDELLSILDFVKPKLFQDMPLIGQLRELMQPHFLRRRKQDVLPELPPKTHVDSWVELMPSQRQAYDKAEQEGRVFLEELGETVTVQHVLALITRLKQICNFDPETEESAKLELLGEMLDGVVDGGAKAVLFSQYVKTLKFVENGLQSYVPLMFHGTLSEFERDTLLTNFKNNPDHTILLVSLKAGGTGLNLEHASYVFHYDLWWNPAVERQAEDRVHRIGQNNPVTIYRLLAQDTIEDRICEILKRKQALFDDVIEHAPQAEVEQLSVEELFEVVGIDPSLARGKQKSGTGNLSGIKKLSPTAFEDKVCNLYQAMGYTTKRTQASRDGGIDVLARRQEGGATHLVAVQCKRYEDMVGVGPVRELWGVVSADQRITTGAIVTTGKFSNDAERFAEQTSIELIDGQKLLQLLMNYEVDNDA